MAPVNRFKDGFCEETVGFYALLSATMMPAGFDALTGAMMVLLGAGVGCLGSTVNPFATAAGNQYEPLSRK